MTEFKKQELYFDVSNNNHQVKELTRKCEYIQGFVDMYNSLGLGELQTKELAPLFQNTIPFLTRKLTGGEPLTIGKMNAQPDKVFEIVEKPHGTTELIEQIKKHNHSRSNRENYDLAKFAIEANEVIVAPQTIERIKKLNTVTAENERQLQAFKLLQNITANLNELKALTGGQLSFDTLQKDFIKRGPYGVTDKYYADFLPNAKSLKTIK